MVPPALSCYLVLKIDIFFILGVSIILVEYISAAND